MSGESFIDMQGLEPLIKRLTEMGQLKKVKAGMHAAGLYLKGQVAKYPPARHGPQPFANDKSRRAFFLFLKHGLIEVPYRRGQSAQSERLGQSWHIEVRDGGFSAVVGTAASYARLVQDDELQTSYHQATGWGTVQQVGDVHGDAAIEFVRQALVEETEG